MTPDPLGFPRAGGPIRVNEVGRMDNGHHGARAGIDKGVGVDVEVVPGREPPSPGSIKDMPIIEDK